MNPICKQCGTREVEDARADYATPVCFACLPPPEPLPVSVLRVTLEIALREEWLALRDDARYYDCAAAVVRFAGRCGLLSKDEQELWLRRFLSCPGHDDEGGRSWCAFCGNMP